MHCALIHLVLLVHNCQDTRRLVFMAMDRLPSLACYVPILAELADVFSYVIFLNKRFQLNAFRQVSKLGINTIVGFFIFVSTCILERVFSHLEGMCSNCK